MTCSWRCGATRPALNADMKRPEQLAAADVDQLTAIAKKCLKSIQYPPPPSTPSRPKDSLASEEAVESITEEGGTGAGRSIDEMLSGLRPGRMPLNPEVNSPTA
jgi:hypothetical protein